MLSGDVSVSAPGESGQNKLVAVADKVDRLLTQMTFVISHRESLCYEKEKCLKWVSPRLFFAWKDRGYKAI